MSTLASANLSVGKGEHRMSLDAKSMSSTLEDDKILKELGYAPSFKREFSNLATAQVSRKLSALSPHAEAYIQPLPNYVRLNTGPS
ncbi:hypothetical protein PHLCEN_2v6829 [Hermanssonia centrifuga]|uniref:Uncharacterized protein n=1 Tax=Hermanssonia centrifuga TaxID=98765 RepID=A0A2R6NYV9_9APHY|nr:hypothetical protein PHLCEN_2v6829 [Hermanssonia centrifuga]